MATLGWAIAVTMLVAIVVVSSWLAWWADGPRAMLALWALWVAVIGPLALAAWLIETGG